MAKKKATKKEENSLNLETILFNCRDYLRGSASLNDKRDVILTLVFLRFIGEKFDDAQAEMRQQCISTEELLMKRKSQDSLIPPLATKI